MIFNCPECDAEYDVTIYYQPGPDAPPMFCPYCKALVKQAQNTTTDEAE